MSRVTGSPGMGRILNRQRFNEQNGSGKTSVPMETLIPRQESVRLRMIYVNNKTTAEIGDNAQITAKSLLVKAEKQQVSAKLMILAETSRSTA